MESKSQYLHIHYQQLLEHAGYTFVKDCGTCNGTKGAHYKKGNDYLKLMPFKDGGVFSSDLESTTFYRLITLMDYLNKRK